MRRRTLLATTAGLGTALLAGCSGGGGGSTDGGGGGGGGGGGSGTFSLLISDQPAAIGDFESLDVTLDTARVFRAEEDETITEGAVTGTPAGTETPEETPTESPTPDGTPAEDEDDEEEGEGFVEFDLDGTTVDLTTVVGDRALPVLEGELAAGRYSGIELSVTSAEGVVDGETVDVKVPSNRLRLVKPFEVAADTELSFVFDIRVVQRGPRNGYNLLPVIGESGVVGRDVEVEEVADDAPDEDRTATPEGTATPDGAETTEDSPDAGGRGNAGN